MGCETETSIVKCVLTDRVLIDETRLALLVRILWHLHLILRQLGLVVVIVGGDVDL